MKIALTYEYVGTYGVIYPEDLATDEEYYQWREEMLIEYDMLREMVGEPG